MEVGGMTRPHGLAAVLKTFGDPTPYRLADGTVSAGWEMATLRPVSLPGTIPLGWDPSHLVRSIRAHRLLADVVGATFDSIHAAGLWPLLRSYDGCYAWRVQRGSHAHLSCHAWGIAIDINAATNKLGEEGDMPSSLVQLFEAQGWYWGGRFDRLDMQHFQWAEGY